MMRRDAFCFALKALGYWLLLLGLAACAHTPSRAVSQGPNAFPSASPLTDFEVDTLQTLARSPQDTEALLSLAFILGGELRSAEGAAPYIAKFKAFLTAVAPALEAEKDPWRKGFLLHSRLHADLLGQSPKAAALSNYDFDQTRPDLVLKTRRYNCISSAILYGLSAAHFGFEVKGVTVPEHVFIELGYPGWDKTVEVETTSAMGFDWIHDERYYSEREQQWAKERGFRPISFADYRQRGFLTLPQLVLEMYHLQHTREARMSRDDAMRLAEIAAALDPRLGTQLARLRFLSNKAHALWETPAAYLRLTDALAPQLEKDVARFATEPEARPLLASLTAARAVALARLRPERTAEILRFAELTATLAPADGKDRRGLLENALFSVREAWRHLLEKQRFAEAREVFLRGLAYYSEPAAKAKDEAYLQNEIGNYHFKRREWAEAVAAYEPCKTLQFENWKNWCAANMGVVFMNWAAEKTAVGDWQGAAEVLGRCLAQCPEKQACQEALERLRAQHRGVSRNETNAAQASRRF